jgi:hypothetical protein
MIDPHRPEHGRAQYGAMKPGETSARGTEGEVEKEVEGEERERHGTVRQIASSDGRGLINCALSSPLLLFSSLLSSPSLLLSFPPIPSCATRSEGKTERAEPSVVHCIPSRLILSRSLLILSRSRLVPSHPSTGYVSLLVIDKFCKFWMNLI